MILICLALYAAPSDVEPTFEACDWHDTSVGWAVAACQASEASDCIVEYEPRTLLFTVRFEFDR